MRQALRPASAEDAVEEWLQELPARIGEIFIARRAAKEIALCHRDDAGHETPEVFSNAEAAIEIARYDDAGVYRPLKTAPNLRHGWLLLLADFGEVRRALNYFYPARLAVFARWSADELKPTALRETLGRQTGMYRTAAKISDEQADSLVGNFCRSEGGCLRTILWKRDALGASPSSLLPPEKFAPAFDQSGRGEKALPLFCQEGCNLLVAEARKVVKAGR
ncbi:MAG: DR2241 family protein [Chthoniobacterales bacterium]